jgi:hypothetical protein
VAVQRMSDYVSYVTDVVSLFVRRGERRS